MTVVLEKAMFLTKQGLDNSTSTWNYATCKIGASLNCFTKCPLEQSQYMFFLLAVISDHRSAVSVF